MAATDGRRSPEEVRLNIERERDELARAVEALREDLGEAADITGKLRSKLPLVAGGALGLGFVAAGTFPTVKEPFMIVKCGSQLNLYVPSTSVTSKVESPVAKNIGGDVHAR